MRLAAACVGTGASLADACPHHSRQGPVGDTTAGEVPAITKKLTKVNATDPRVLGKERSLAHRVPTGHRLGGRGAGQAGAFLERVIRPRSP
jgi:hypothetical protein